MIAFCHNSYSVLLGANPITANDQVDPLLSSIAGVSLTISHEHPDVPVTLIDFPMSATNAVCTAAAIRFMTNPPVDESEVRLVPSADGKIVRV